MCNHNSCADMSELISNMTFGCVHQQPVEQTVGDYRYTLTIESIEVDEVIQRLNPIFKKISKEEQQELNKWEK